MAGFTDKQLRKFQIGGAAVAFIGLVVALLTKPPHDYSFWLMYKTGFFGVGIVALLLGLVWTAMAAAHQYTDFFRLDKSLNSDGFMLQIAAILIASVVLIAIIIPRIEETPPEKLPKDNKERLTFLQQERTYKWTVGSFIAVSALVLASFSSRRFLQK